jgi:carbamoyltransferase
MKICGFHSWHDCAFCVLDEGVPVIHAELERYTREKEPKGDALALFYEKYDASSEVIHFTHVLDAEQGGVKYRYNESFKKMEDQLKDTGGKFHVVGHHLAHAAHGFYSSNFEEAVIITIDGGGSELDDNGFSQTTATGLFQGSKKSIKRLDLLPYLDLDIGGFWTHCTKEIFGLSGGYPKGHQAGTVMAMACMGNPEKWGDYFLKTGLRPDRFVHKTQRDSFYEAVHSTDYENGEWYGTVPPKEVEKNAPYIMNQIDFNALRSKAMESEQERFDIAAGIQWATEEILKKIIEDVIKTGISKNLCLSGGCVLNSVFVGKIKDWFGDSFDNIYVAPVPYDAGLAIGAAQYVWHHVLENDRIKWEDNFTPYLGEKYSKNSVLKAVKNEETLTYCNATDDDVLNLLADEKIVSVFGGGSESGRRALGNRSILADPRSSSMKDMINEKVKHRQWFRPFAPSILREEVENWFVRDISSPYMSFVIKFKDEVIDKVPAVVHFDKTARLQTVTENDNKWYYNFLKKWDKLSGVPIILNTSFNDREPIVENPQDAVSCFVRTEIDYLYFFDYGILCKKDG